MIRILFAIGAIGLAASASATEVPRYERAPEWVVAPPTPAADGTSPLLTQILDQQTRVADGTVWSYQESAVRAISADTLSRIGTITIGWQPFHGDLIIHRVDIIRDGQRIDALKAGQKFTVIRREQMLERMEMDGRLTATLQVEGLRVGDVLDWSYSITTRDPALKGNVQAGEMVPSEPFKIGFARARFVWSDSAPLKWRVYPAGAEAIESSKAGWHELTIKLPAPKPPELPGDAPARFHRLSFAEVSSFASWEDVSRINAPLYSTKGSIPNDSPIAQEVARIKAATPDLKKRAAMALELVQDRIRYFANGMNGGNYVPQTVAQTWSAGYGDCKAKTLLLLALLDALDVKAEPVLANLGQGDFVADRLPALAAFNHIFVHATIGNEDLWLDGTGRGSRLEDLGDPPAFRWVLPVRSGGAGLLALPLRAPALPTRIVSVDIDQSAGLALPAPFTATVTLRGAAADSLRVLAAQLDQEKLQGLALLALNGAIAPSASPTATRISFDQAAGTAEIDVAGITSLAWQRQDHRYRYRPASSISGLSLTSDRSRAAWKDIPVATGSASKSMITTRIKLPDGGKRLTLEGDPKLTLDLPARTLVRTTALTDGTLTIIENAATSGAEIQPAELAGVRTRLSDAQNRIPRITTSTDYPPEYAQVAAAKRMRKLDQLAQLYAARIAEKPGDVSRYLARAAFYEATFQWAEALADLDKAIAMDANAANLLRRANLYERLGDKPRSAADFRAILALEPRSKVALARLAVFDVDMGRKATALEPIDVQIAEAGEDKPEWLDIKAEVLAREGQVDAALAALDEAVSSRPGSAAMLSNRCWVKVRLAVQLESAIADCTRALELSPQNPTIALDSRALGYLRLNRMPEALADVNAALEQRPSASGPLFLRAAIERRMGNTLVANADLVAAKMISPHIAEDYAYWKVTA